MRSPIFTAGKQGSEKLAEESQAVGLSIHSLQVFLLWPE